jgi:tetratricopeptide (TPR) repeat protein
MNIYEQLGGDTMRQRHLASNAIVAFFLISIAIGIIQTSAQQSASISSQPVNATTELERRIFQLEVVQAQTIEALRSSIDSYKSSMTWFSILITILIAIQGGIFYGQWRREGERASRDLQREETRSLVERTGAEQFSKLIVERESRQGRHEEARLGAELKGVDEVSKVMALVEQTLASRLATEKDARDKLDEIRGQIGSLKKFYENFQGAIENSRDSIEKAGILLAQTPRQDFRSRTDELNIFSKQFDDFIRDFVPIEDKERRFSPQVTYIRGIAAHYANDPERAKQYLSDVIGFHKPEEGESEIDYNRRVANAYYYLGLIESNFSNYRNAIDYFIKAKPESQKDFRTMVATAEAYLMNKEFKEAMGFISMVKKELHDTKGLTINNLPNNS